LQPPLDAHASNVSATDALLFLVGAVEGGEIHYGGACGASLDDAVDLDAVLPCHAEAETTETATYVVPAVQERWTVRRGVWIHRICACVDPASRRTLLSGGHAIEQLL
jgi:hypothetical protein